jgi:hypothetical protein
MKRIIIFAITLIIAFITIFVGTLLLAFSLTGCQSYTDKKEKHVHVNPIIVLPHSTTDDVIHSIDEPSESVHVEPTEPVHVEPAIR